MTPLDRSCRWAMALLALARHGVAAPAADDAESGRRYEPNPTHRARYAERQVQFEAAYAALLPISEALS